MTYSELVRVMSEIENDVEFGYEEIPVPEAEEEGADPS
jgi:hypothetical protein